MFAFPSLMRPCAVGLRRGTVLGARAVSDRPVFKNSPMLPNLESLPKTTPPEGISKVFKLPKDMSEVEPAPEEPRIPTAPELWTKEKTNYQTPPMPRAQPGEAFAHPLYTARPTVDTSLGPVIPPLHYPENDQSVVSTAESGINQEPYYRPTDFDDPKDAPLGGYPQVRHQWALLRNPFTYWDPQGRRNYGEILPDNYNLVDVWGPGPTAPLRDVGRAIFIIAGAVLTVTAGIAVWDPAHHRAIAPKDYPFDGLRISMGGDPQNPQDRELVAPTYSER